MNTAAPSPSHAHTQQATSQDATTNVRSGVYTTERISAQEAMKGMRISEPQQHNRRRKSGEMNDAYRASRIDRHLANRAQSVREKELPSKVATIERRRSKLGNSTSSNSHHIHAASTAPAAPSLNTSKPSIISKPHSSNNTAHRNEDSGCQSHQMEANTQGSQTVQQDQESHAAPTQQPQQKRLRNQKVPIPPSSSNDNSSTVSATTAQPSSLSGRQSRLSNVNSGSKESYRRKYGDIRGYTYIGTIGQGNFGKVLLAENDITGEQVAVKILEKSQFKSEQQRLHATREARLMATLRHPNIVDVKAVMEDDYRILIVMENLTGGELFDYISNKGSLDEKEARRIFRQIVLAIHYCHESNVVHRDLKPENILLDSKKNIRVADFGFGNNWHKDRHLTTYCGSPFYAAPEMVSGTPYIGPETDVWSLGVILYVLICGRLPFDASDLPALFAQIKRGSYQKPREGSIDVCSLIHRMLTVDPKRRATLADVLRSRWMRADGIESMVAPLPALSTAPSTIRPTAVRPQQQHQHHHHQARSTHHPNNDISTTTPAGNPTVNTAHEQQSNHNRSSYHPPGALELQQQEIAASPPNDTYPNHPQQQQQQIQTPQPVPFRDLQESDDQMSDVCPSLVSSPTETMATISPSTPVGPISRDEALTAAAAAVNGMSVSAYQKRYSTITTSAFDEKHQHHPYKHHSRNSSHACGHSVGQGPENVMISMCPSSDTFIDNYDASSKKKRKALTKLRQFFRFETAHATKC
ncbi:NUAK SNF1-like kinase 2 [Mortierella claussenii]|nr:NUAK SNF1-like kinase 2 [Mortierella claussenii]